jgi:cell division protein FtsB
VTSIFFLHLLSWISLSYLKKIIILSSLKFLLNWIIVSPEELKKVKQEKESLIVQLSESHALIDSSKSENTMLFDIIDTLKNKLKESENLLKKFSGDNLKSMLCIHSDISNKPGLTVDLSTSTSHASDSELDSVDTKLVIVDEGCSENSCLNNCVKPNSKCNALNLSQQIRKQKPPVFT